MKVLNYLAAAALLLAVSTVSFSIGRTSTQSTKDYQVACLLGDICKFAIDNGNTEFEELYEDYLGNIDCDPRVLVTREEVEQYTWIYK